MKIGVPNVTAHLSLFLSLLLPFIRAILHHTENHNFRKCSIKLGFYLT